MEFFNTLNPHTNGLAVIICSAIFFPAIAFSNDKISESSQELISEVKQEIIASTEEYMGTATEVVKEMNEKLSATKQTQTRQVILAEASTSSEDKPYTVSEDGKVDWYTFNGYRRYHSECHVCHGPAGLGSSFAPNLTESAKVLGYAGFLNIVVSGKVSVNNVENKNMPSFASNMNVMCYISDIYAYLAARADGIIGTGRPKKEAKPEAAKKRDDSCSAG